MYFARPGTWLAFAPAETGYSVGYKVSNVYVGCAGDGDASPAEYGIVEDAASVVEYWVAKADSGDDSSGVG